MAVSASEIGWGWRLLRNNVNRPNMPLFLQNPALIRFTTATATTTTRWSFSCVVPRALDPKTEDQNSTTCSQEDLAYVAKLVVGSLVGAGAIKYGSALFPQITTPNLVLALIIIITPVLVAIFLLIKESRPKP